ncbi:CRISPR-associated endonuclease Cas1 [Saccharopolyspora sp. 6M]|uniref:CRISPR-associated endonuclease Cas1 n=1 Tax=Saccharopolyspora sp. 6M TaxID=2877237 RepID=UPI001CD5B59C|nr:CRISPR-associated endonuclease Cas1 [Saccharopolyspora sp. 6M]MCA1229827.1 CRISPR-associated endonuclease Cas1 [Saccharopolyspora sp. 6M]
MTADSGRGEPIPISLAAHHSFCPRRAWLEAVGERTDTHQVAVGQDEHAATDDVAGTRPQHVRGIEVGHDQLGIIGRCDTVEFDDAGAATVLEYKATPLRRRPEVTEPMRMQLALQVLALQQQSITVVGQAVFFTHHQQRVPVALTAADFDTAQELVNATRNTVEARTAPAPLEDDPRCARCSHISVCLPDERVLEPVHRRIVVADPDTQVLHLSTPGMLARLRSGRIILQHHGEKVGAVPLERVQAVVVHGNVDLSGGLIRELLWRSLPIAWCSSTGRVIGSAGSTSSPNADVRLHQHVASGHGRLDLAREFVSAKIANQATLLRRHGHDRAAVHQLRELQHHADHADSVPGLFGLEGDAAARYFRAFPALFTTLDVAEASFTTRTRRPATDPINAALNFAYGLLSTELLRAITACGLDPHAGFLHSATRNKPALALDLGEEFRAPVADSVVLGAFNNGELALTDFYTDPTGTAVRLTEHGRKSLISAHERRMTGHFTHPLFGYDVTWRRAIEIQARLVLGVLDGTQPRYRGTRIR